MHAPELRQHVFNLLSGRGAHLTFDAAIEDLPPKMYGRRAESLPHSPWELLEHLRICQWDLLEYSRRPDHVSPEFPAGYWPTNSAPESESQWNESVTLFRKELHEMQDLVMDESIDLLAQLPHGQPGHTVLREALILADHNAYHLGQLVMVRKALGCWEG